VASQQDIAAVRHFYDEVARGNFWVGKDVFDPAIEWQWNSSLSGITGNRTYRGFSEVEAATRDWLQSWEWFRIELEELIDAGEKVVALTRQLGRPHGASADVAALAAEVWTMRHGKAIAFHGYIDREEALQAAGLAS
jgi:ketosteroid isomerase-like protein